MEANQDYMNQAQAQAQYTNLLFSGQSMSAPIATPSLVKDMEEVFDKERVKYLTSMSFMRNLVTDQDKEIIRISREKSEFERKALTLESKVKYLEEEKSILEKRIEEERSNFEKRIEKIKAEAAVPLVPKTKDQVKTSEEEVLGDETPIKAIKKVVRHYYNLYTDKSEVPRKKQKSQEDIEDEIMDEVLDDIEGENKSKEDIEVDMTELDKVLNRYHRYYCRDRLNVQSAHMTMIHFQRCVKNILNITTVDELHRIREIETSKRGLVSPVQQERIDEFVKWFRKRYQKNNE